MTSPVQVIGLDSLLGKFSNLKKAVQPGRDLLDVLEAAGVVVQVFAMNNAREKLNKHPTGNLVQSIKVERKVNHVLVGAFGVIYAKIHEFGGVISPRKAKALHFQIDGQWVTAKRVVIPSRPYLRPAVNENMPAIRDAAISALNGLISKRTR